MDYKNGKIYRIVCEETGRQYIGSTCSTLVKRLSNHKKNNRTCNAKTSCHDFINPSIFLIEDYPCDRKDQLLMRERYHMENIQCVNIRRPIISKEDRSQYNRQYRLENIEDIKKRQSNIITCECGKNIAYKSIARHKKSKKHIKFLEQ